MRKNVKRSSKKIHTEPKNQKAKKSNNKVETKKHKTQKTKQKISKSLKKHYANHPRRTKHIGKNFDDIKTEHIKEGRLNQIIMNYEMTWKHNGKNKKQKYEVSVIVKNKKDLKKKLKLLTLYNVYENRKKSLKIISFKRYVLKKRKK